MEFFISLENFSFVRRRLHCRWRVANFDLFWNLWPLISEGSLACHTYCDKGHRRFCIFTILLSSPLGKGRCPAFEQTLIPFTQRCLLPSLVEIGSVVLEKKMKMWKVYWQVDRQTMDNKWSEKLTWANKNLISSILSTVIK